MRVKTAPNMEMVIYAFILYEIILSQFDKGIFYLINDDVMMNDYSKNVNKLKLHTYKYVDDPDPPTARGADEEWTPDDERSIDPSTTRIPVLGSERREPGEVNDIGSEEVASIATEDLPPLEDEPQQEAPPVEQPAAVASTAVKEEEDETLPTESDSNFSLNIEK